MILTRRIMLFTTIFARFLIVSGITTTLTIPVVAQEFHADLCLHGCPKGSPATNDIVIRDIYILSSNDTTKFADWVAYRVTKSTIGKTETRSWKADPQLADNETLEPDDYKNANAVLKTDRGHQAPLASFTSTSSWKTTNYLSNITPQKSALNQGPWKKLEDAVRELAKKPANNAVYVMTGPLYEREMPALPNADEDHRVPSGYWKIIATEKNSIIKIAAFLFDQETKRNANYCDSKFSTTVDTVESKTGLDFFFALTPEKQSELETGSGTLRSELGCR